MKISSELESLGGGAVLLGALALAHPAEAAEAPAPIYYEFCYTSFDRVASNVAPRCEPRNPAEVFGGVEALDDEERWGLKAFSYFSLTSDAATEVDLRTPIVHQIVVQYVPTEWHPLQETVGKFCGVRFGDPTQMRLTDLTTGLSVENAIDFCPPVRGPELKVWQQSLAEDLLVILDGKIKSGEKPVEKAPVRPILKIFNVHHRKDGPMKPGQAEAFAAITNAAAAKATACLDANYLPVRPVPVVNMRVDSHGAAAMEFGRGGRVTLDPSKVGPTYSQLWSFPVWATVTTGVQSIVPFGDSDEPLSTDLRLVTTSSYLVERESMADGKIQKTSVEDLEDGLALAMIDSLVEDGFYTPKPGPWSTTPVPATTPATPPKAKMDVAIGPSGACVEKPVGDKGSSVVAKVAVRLPFELIDNRDSIKEACEVDVGARYKGRFIVITAGVDLPNE